MCSSDLASSLLAGMPDQVPKDIVSSLREKSTVLPVALPPLKAPVNVERDRPRIVWNHRWEHDKGPELLQQIVVRLLEQNREFSMSLLGQRFARVPAAMQEVKKLLIDAGRLDLGDYMEDRAAYLGALGRHNLVLSTAGQEFQGLAVQEAMLRGCTPVVPDALSYPEYVPAQLRYTDAAHAVELLMSAPVATIDLERYSWQTIGPEWLATVNELVRLR